MNSGSCSTWFLINVGEDTYSVAMLLAGALGPTVPRTGDDLRHQALNHAQCELLEPEPSALSDAAIDEEVRRVAARVVSALQLAASAASPAGIRCGRATVTACEPADSPPQPLPP
jgi:hypothetical protein